MSWTQVEEAKEILEADRTAVERLQASEKPNAESMVERAYQASQGKAKERKVKSKADMVNHPPHYTSHPSGVECIQITEHMGFNLGNALKYIWRADLKGSAVEDLEKAIFYINRELDKRRTK
jgi:hypothetical protein